MAVDTSGRTAATLRPEGARRIDWEALERVDCPEGSCLWIADTGDNQERRDDAVLYRVVEPEIPDGGRPAPQGSREPRSAPAADVGGDLGGEVAPGDAPSISVPSRAHPIRFPDGPRDVEALFALPGEDLYFVTKGRNHPVTVYRYPPPLRPGERVTLVAVQELTDGPAILPSQVTGAATDPDGTRVVVRTYQELSFYGVEGSPGEVGPDEGGGLHLEVLDGGRVDLTSLREAQGEGVAWLPEGRLVLVSEAGPAGRMGGMRVLRCRGLGGS